MALLFSALFLLWSFGAVADILDGAVTINGKDVDASTDPFRFWMSAIVIAVVELYALTMLLLYLNVLRWTKDEEQ